jgi:WD40 repeat protein
MVVALAGVFRLWKRSEWLLALTRQQAFNLRLDQAIVLCDQGYVDRGVLIMAEQLKDYRSSPAAEQYVIRANVAAWSPYVIAPERLATGIQAAKWVPNVQNRLIATIDSDGNPQVWNFATGKPAEKGLEPIGAPLETPSRKTPPLPSLWFSDDGKILIGSAGDDFVRLWNRDTGRHVGPPIPVRNTIRGLALSEDHRLMATRSDNDIKRWDVTTGRPVKTVWLPEKSPRPQAVALYPNRVVTRDERGVYRLHDLDSGQGIGRPMPSAKDSQLERVKERKALLICWDESDQKSWFQAWSVETGEPLGSPWFADSKKHKRVELPNGSRSAPPRGFSRSNLVLSLGDTILVCDIATGNPLGEPIQTGGTVDYIQIRHEEKLLVWINQEVQLWDLATRRRIGEGLKFDQFIIELSADAHRVLLYSGVFRPGDRPRNINFVDVWDVPMANKRRLALSSRYSGEGSIGLDPSGTSLMLLSKELTLYRCDLSRSDTEHSWLDAASVAALMVSDTPTLRYALKFSDPGQTLLEVNDNESMNPVGPPVHLNAYCKFAMESPRHDLILTGCEDGSAQLWSLPTLAPFGVVMRHSGAVASGAFSPDGRTIATGSGRTARLWDATRCRPIGPPMEHPEDIKGVYFSTDARWLLVKCDEKGAYRWPMPVPMEGDADAVLDRVKELTR